MMKSTMINCRSFFPLLALCLPVMIACIDIMAISVALNEIMQQMKSGINKTSLLISGYTIGTASFFIIIGRIADKYGRKKTLLSGILLFTLASLISASSYSINLLIAGRFLQGVASAMMMTTVVAIITHTFAPEKRGIAIGTWGMSLGIGLAIGPLVGGIILYFANWRWIFLINIPICLISYYFVKNYIAESKDQKNNTPINWGSSSLLSVLLLSLCALLSEGTRIISNFMSGFYTIIFIFIILFLFLRQEKKISSPIIDTQLFKYRNFLAATLIGGISYFCQYSWLFLFNIYLQNIIGFSVLSSSFVLIAYSCAFAINSQLTGKMMKRFGNKIVMQYGLAVIFISMFFMSQIGRSTSIYQIVFLCILFGIGVTASNAPSLNAATEFIPSEKAGVASGMIFTIRWFSGTIGVAVMTVLFEHTNTISSCFISLAGLSILGVLISTAYLSPKQLK